MALIIITGIRFYRANGMQCTKTDELKLREMQKMQMQERKSIEQYHAEVDELWHQVLLEDVRMKVGVYTINIFITKYI